MQNNFAISYISSISIDNLLIFYGFGIILLIFSSQSKMTLLTQKDHIPESKLARCAGIYRFIKTIFNWGFIYFVSGVSIMIASIFPTSSIIFRPLFYNISFVLALITTLYLTLAYLILVIRELIMTWIYTREYDLN